MSLLMDIQDSVIVLRATPDSIAALATAPEMVEMMAETLRAKGKVRFTKTMPACMSGACSGSCCDTPTTAAGKRVPVRVYEWIGARS